MKRYLLVLALVAIFSQVTASALQETIEPSMSAGKNLRFFGVTKTVAMTTTVYHTQPLYVHPTCIVLAENLTPCTADPPTTTTEAATTTTEAATTPQPTAAPPKPIVITPGGTAQVLSAGITINRPALPNIQFNLPAALSPAAVAPPVIIPPVGLMVKPLSLDASAAAAIAVHPRNVRRALQETVEPSSVATYVINHLLLNIKLK